MITRFILFTCALISMFITTASAQDDVYFNPGRKPKPLKNRKEYTPIALREPTAGTSLYFYAEPVTKYIYNDKAEKEIYYYIFLQGAKYIEKPGEEKVPMNISFVIDRSGSMSGKKLEDVKKAVEFAIQQLQPGDYVSVVKYDDRIETVFEPIKAESWNEISRKIKEIESGGSTNLCGGMEKGLEYVKYGMKNFSGNRSIHRVILLSDGLANTGITDPAAISEIARKYNLENNITLSTIGVGADYNEDLMTKISVDGGGSYYFINNTEELPEIFAKEFGDMKTLVAKDVVLEITFPQGVTFDKVFQYPYSVKEKTIRIRLTDFFAEQQKAILIKFRTSNDYGSEMDFRTKLAYSNTTDGQKEITDTRSSVVMCTNKQDLANEGINADAHMGYTLMLSAEYLAKAQAAADSRNFSSARDYLKKGMDLIEEHFCFVIPNPYLEDVYKDMKQYKEEISELETTKDPIRFSIIQKGSKCKGYNRSYKSCRFL